MIDEFAVDPLLLTNWERFRYLTENFGVHKGRLISRYPKKWKTMVHDELERAEPDDNNYLRIVEKLATIDEKMLKRDHQWDPSRDCSDWLVNAERENNTRPFHAIISLHNPRNERSVLVYEELDENNPFWRSRTEREVPRTAKDLSAIAAPLLRIASHVVFVDPYLFDSKNENVKTKLVRSIDLFLDACMVGRLNGFRLEAVEVCTKFRDIKDLEALCRNAFSPVIPLGVKLNFIFYREKKNSKGIHNRYILTSRGGIKFPWGLDEGKPGQIDIVNLLQRDAYLDLCADYSPTLYHKICGHAPEGGAAFDVEMSFEIEGSKSGGNAGANAKRLGR